MRRSIAQMMVLLLLGIAGCCGKAGSPTVDHGWDDLEGVWIEYDYDGQDFYGETFTLQRKEPEGRFVMHADVLVEIGERTLQRQQLTQTVSDRHLKLFLDALMAPAWTRHQGTQAMRTKLAPASVELDRALMSSWQCHARGEKSGDALFSSRKARQSLVDRHYEKLFNWTDDYPFISAHVSWKGKSGMTVISRSQKAMMLPWETVPMTDPTDQSMQNWSSDVSRTMAGLLPPESRAHQRLTRLDTDLRHLHSLAEYEAERACADE